MKDTIKKRMKEDLDVVDILKRLRELQVIVDNSKIDDRIRYKINHSFNNVINLENHDQELPKFDLQAVLVQDVDRDDSPTPKKRYDDMFKFGNSPFTCQCIGSSKIDGK